MASERLHLDDVGSEKPSPVSLELRVHGVHNTPPASMLGIDKTDVVQVAGDDVTGFYRSRSGELPYRRPKAGLAVEAYSWGALTSGVGGFLGWLKRALWLLLLPFALANMAYWARLRVGATGADRRPGAASAVRVASLLLTVFAVLVACTVFIDLVGWQCYRNHAEQCRGMPGWASWLTTVSSGQRLAVGALGPIALVVVFVWLTNRSLARYERAVDPLSAGLAARSRAAGEGREVTDARDEDGRLADTRPSDQVILRHDLWQGEPRTAALRNAHVAAALAIIVGFVSVHVLTVWLAGGGWFAAYVVAVVLAAMVFLVSLVVVAARVPGDVEDQLLSQRFFVRLASHSGLLAAAAVVLTVAVLGMLVWSPEDFDVFSGFAGRNAWFVAVFVALTAMHLTVFFLERVEGRWRFWPPVVTVGALVVGMFLVYRRLWFSHAEGPGATGLAVAVCVLVAVFAVIAIWHYGLATTSREVARRPGVDPRADELARSAFSGAGASVLLAASAWTMLLFASATVIGAANVLNGSAPVTDLTFEPPAEGSWIRHDFHSPLVVPQVMLWAPVAQVLWLLLVTIAVTICVRRFRPARDQIRASRYDGVPPPDIPGAQRARVGAALLHRAEQILDVVGSVTSPVALALIVVSAQPSPPSKILPDLLVDISLYAVVAAAAGLVLLGSQVRTSDSIRRAVGVIWDLSTFWPRAAHPLAPPCYAERVVPEISRRVTWALGLPGERLVVLSGHSQGSLIVTTVIARLPRLDRIRVLTYGSQVRALYGRFFPAIFGPDVVGCTTTTGPFRLSEAAPDLPTPEPPEQVPPPGAGVHSVRRRFDDLSHWKNLFRRTDPLGFRVFSDIDSVVDVPTLEVPTEDWGDSGPTVKGHSDYQHSPEYRVRLRDWTEEDLVGPPTSTTDVLPLPEP